MKNWKKYVQEVPMTEISMDFFWESEEGDYKYSTTYDMDTREVTINTEDAYPHTTQLYLRTKMLAKRWLNYDNEKEYELYCHCYNTRIDVYNLETEKYDWFRVQLVLND